MKKNALYIAAGLFLVVVFVFAMFSFFVRVTECAVLTTFGRPTARIMEPGLYFKFPSPVQKDQHRA